MSIPDDIALQIVHGTPRGYELGCKTQGGCANHGHRTLMTCADAAKALRSDWELRKLPADQPFEKKVRRLARPAKPSTAAAAPQVTRDARQEPTAREPKPITHGTVWGYMQGCTTPETCPNHDSADALTCSDARRKYRADYAARRLAGKAARSCTEQPPATPSDAMTARRARATRTASRAPTLSGSPTRSADASAASSRHPSSPIPGPLEHTSSPCSRQACR